MESSDCVDCVDRVDCVCCHETIWATAAYHLTSCCYQKICLACCDDIVKANQLSSASCPNCSLTIPQPPQYQPNLALAKSLWQRVGRLKEIILQSKHYRTSSIEAIIVERNRLTDNSAAIMSEIQRLSQVTELVNSAELINALASRNRAVDKGLTALMAEHDSAIKQLASQSSYLTSLSTILQPALSDQAIAAAKLVEIVVNLEQLQNRSIHNGIQPVPVCKLRLIQTSLGYHIIEDRLSEQLKCLAVRPSLRLKPQQTWSYPDLTSQLFAIGLDLDGRNLKTGLIELPGLADNFLLYFSIQEYNNSDLDRVALVNSSGNVIYQRHGYHLCAVNHKWLVIAKDHRFYLEPTPTPGHDGQASKLKPIALSQTKKGDKASKCKPEVVALQQDKLYVTRGQRLLTYQISAMATIQLVADVATAVTINSCHGPVCEYTVPEDDDINFVYCGCFQPDLAAGLPQHQDNQYHLKVSVDRTERHLGEGTILINHSSHHSDNDSADSAECNGVDVIDDNYDHTYINRIILSDQGVQAVSEKLSYDLQWSHDRLALQLFSDGRLYYLEQPGRRIVYFGQSSVFNNSGPLRVTCY